MNLPSTKHQNRKRLCTSCPWAFIIYLLYILTTVDRQGNYEAQFPGHNLWYQVLTHPMPQWAIWGANQSVGACKLWQYMGWAPELCVLGADDGLPGLGKYIVTRRHLKYKSQFWYIVHTNQFFYLSCHPTFIFSLIRVVECQESGPQGQF